MIYRIVEYSIALISGISDGLEDVMLAFGFFGLAFLLPLGVGFLLSACKAYYDRRELYRENDSQSYGSRKLNILERIGKISAITFWIPAFLVAAVTVPGAIMVMTLAKLPQIGLILLAIGAVALVVGIVIVVLCIMHDRKKPVSNRYKRVFYVKA